VRDLGGLRTSDGRVTRRGAVVRGDNLDRLSPAGWSALEAYGIRTVVDLRNDDELGHDGAPRPAGIATVRVPLDDAADTEMWEGFWADGLDGSPLYYRPFLERKPERCAAAISAVARAAPGGVVVHCGAGRDRTGLVTMLLLALVGVAPDEIASDYELSADRLPPLFAALGMDDQGPEIEALLARKGVTARAALLAALEWLDIGPYLRSGGLGEDDLAAARARLLGSAAPTTGQSRCWQL
jgi:hypothetical protein